MGFKPDGIYDRYIKRAFDIGLSAPALIALSPLYAFTAAGIKLSSKGPVFYHSDRVGKNKRQFPFYKFRSMHETDHNKGLHIADAERLFPFGKFIRRAKLDELPQLINILKGDMSIVGPRPMSTTSTMYDGKYESVRSVRPGLTSPASLYDYIVGDTYTDNDAYLREVLPVKQELELYYVNHISPLYDASLILRTIGTIAGVATGRKFRELPEVGKVRYAGRKVLIFGSAGRQALPVIRGFKDIGCHVTSYCLRKTDTGYLTKNADAKFLYENLRHKGESFEDCGARLIREGHFDLVVPMSDISAAYLARNKEDLSRYACIAVNDWNVFEYAMDKSKTMAVCNENGIQAPKTITSDDPLAEIDAGKIDFPVVVKPVTAVGSIGFSIIRTREALEKYLAEYDGRYGRLLVQQYIEQGGSPQYRVDLFRDREGRYKAALAGKVTRWYPLDGGSGINAITIHDDGMIRECKALLDKIGWNGYANIDLAWDEKAGCAKILEINGRTGASIILDYAAGVNISRLILENELGYDVTDMTDYPDGRQISCLLPDLLWLMKSPERFSTRPSWFNRIGVKDALFSWGDPLPALGFTASRVAGFRESMEKRRRAD